MDLPDGYLLRPPTVADAEAFAATMRANRDHLGPWDPVRPEGFYTAEVQAAGIAGLLESAAAGAIDPWLLMAGEEVVGGFTLNQIVRVHRQSAVLGYWVDHRHLRRGLASAMAARACARGLELGLHRIEAGVDVENTASQGVLRRAGFEEYGVARGLLFLRGGWRDHVLVERILHGRPLGES